MKAGNDEMVFECTGSTFYANNEIVGIDPALRIYEGYDGGVGDDDDFTEAERIELADYMIDLWTQFKNLKPESK